MRLVRDDDLEGIKAGQVPNLLAETITYGLGRVNCLVPILVPYWCNGTQAAGNETRVKIGSHR